MAILSASIVWSLVAVSPAGGQGAPRPAVVDNTAPTPGAADEASASRQPAPSTAPQGSGEAAALAAAGEQGRATVASTAGARPTTEALKASAANAQRASAPAAASAAQTRSPSKAEASPVAGQSQALPGQTSPQTTAQQAAAAPASPAPAVEPAMAPMAGLESSMLQAINQRRAQAGLSPLAVDPTLTAVARQRSSDMAANSYFSHTAPDGSNYITLLRARGIAAGIVGEILGRNNAADELSVGMVVDAFMNSPSHRLHILHADYRWIGVGAAKGGGNMKYFAIVFRGP